MQKQMRIVSPVQFAYDAIKKVSLSPPISLEEFRSMLMSAMEVSMDDQQPIPPEQQPIEQIVFQNIFDFVAWYEVNRSCFNEQQQAALNTLYDTRMGINNGCACRRDQRERIAHEYFGKFWQNNKETDLLAAVAKVAQVKRVIMAALCEWPSPI